MDDLVETLTSSDECPRCHGRNPECQLCEQVRISIAVNRELCDEAKLAEFAEYLASAPVPDVETREAQLRLADAMSGVAGVTRRLIVGGLKKGQAA